MSDSTPQPTLRWGILGTAGIARKNWQAIHRSGNGRVAAVASRDPARAAAWIAENQGQYAFPDPPEAVGGYEALLARDDVDAVYIPLPTGVRKEWVLKAAAAGKHVMCEKPCGAHAADVAEMTGACRAAGVQFMDGVMFMHSDRLPALREALDDGESVGEIKRIASQFSFRAPDDFLAGNIRMHSGLEPLGCLGDLGWYNIRLTLWALRHEMPATVSGRFISQLGRPDSPEAVPAEFSAELTFASGPTAGFYCGFLTEHQQWANISGTRGNVQIDDFVLPWFGATVGFAVSNADFVIDGCDFHMERHVRRVTVPEYGDGHATAQETKLFRNFAALALSGRPDDHWPEIALKTQRVLDACVASARRNGEPVSL